MAKYKFSVGTRHVGSGVTDEFEISDEELIEAGMEDEEEIEYVLEVFKEWACDNIDAYFERVQ